MKTNTISLISIRIRSVFIPSCRCSSQVLTNQERRRFESNSYLAGGVFLTQTVQAPRQGRTSHLWYSSRKHEFDWCHTPKGNTLLGDRDFNPLGLMPVSPSKSLLPPECALDPPIPRLNCITRLRGRNDLSSQLSVRLRLTWLKDVQWIGP
jgi:hypothetical protein